MTRPMQSRALDSSSRLIFAHHADKHKDYRCIECNQTIRLRRGIQRQAHFYHVQPNRACKQHGKGMPHLMLQHFIKNILPEGAIELECRFSSIGRIADAAWHSQSLIFEIQCSPISLEEVKSRNENYASLGYQVIWIFHDTLYNQHRLSSAEDFLRDQPHYFSNMNEQGEGWIYDQFSLITHQKRVCRLPPLAINPAFPNKLNEEIILSKLSWKLPFVLQKRAKAWPIFFSGDTIDSYLNSFSSQNLSEEQKSLFAQFDSKNGKKKWFVIDSFKKSIANSWNQAARLYGALLKLVLERACR